MPSIESNVALKSHSNSLYLCKSQLTLWQDWNTRLSILGSVWNPRCFSLEKPEWKTWKRLVIVMKVFNFWSTAVSLTWPINGILETGLQFFCPDCFVFQQWFDYCCFRSWTLLWHQDVSSRSFRSCNLISGASMCQSFYPAHLKDTPLYSLLGNLEAKLGPQTSFCASQIIPKPV